MNSRSLRPSLRPRDSSSRRAANSATWSLDGTRIAFSTGRDIVTVRLRDRKLARLTHSPKAARRPPLDGRPAEELAGRAKLPEGRPLVRA
jgi:hypothetical protein